MDRAAVYVAFGFTLVQEGVANLGFKSRGETRSVVRLAKGSYAMGPITIPLSYVVVSCRCTKMCRGVVSCWYSCTPLIKLKLFE